MSKGDIPHKSKHDGRYINMYISTLERIHDTVYKILKETLYRRSKPVWFSLRVHEVESNQPENIHGTIKNICARPDNGYNIIIQIHNNVLERTNKDPMKYCQNVIEIIEGPLIYDKEWSTIAINEDMIE